MAKSMYSPGNQVFTKQGRDNFDRIFKKKRLACDEDCACGSKKNKPDDDCDGNCTNKCNK